MNALLSGGPLVWAGIALIGLAGFIMWRKLGGGATPSSVASNTKDRGTIRVLLFTRDRRLLSFRAPTSQGVADLTAFGYGNFPIFPECITYLRTGRPWGKPTDADNATTLRRREPVLVLRELDPEPMLLGASLALAYHGSFLDEDYTTRLKDASQRHMTAELAAQSNRPEAQSKILAYSVLICVLVGMASWGGVALLHMSKGGG